MNYSVYSLNKEQRPPALHTDGAVLVTAGAGSGKTRLLTHRIAHLVNYLNVDPYNILALTFTNKAGNEMKERLNKMLNHSNYLYISTFHSLCVYILRHYIENLSGYTKCFSIYGDTEKEKVIKDYLKQKALSIDYLKIIVKHISNAKNNGLCPTEYKIHIQTNEDCNIIHSAYTYYEQKLFEQNALDFEDLIIKCIQLLKSTPSVLSHYQERFKYIHVDEFQDTNTVQYDLIKLLADKHKNIFVVGDEDQSIYGWRGANIGNIKNFVKDFNATIYKLEQNFRSTPQILEKANMLIKNNKDRIEKKLWTAQKNGFDTEYFTATSTSDETDFVALKIMELFRENNHSYSDFAILLRMNSLTRGFEEKLIQYGIPYKIYGGIKFFDRKEIKDILAYLKLLSNPQDTQSLLRIINYPTRNIGDSTVLKLVKYAEQQNTTLYKTIMNIEKNSFFQKSLIKKILPFKKLLADLNTAKFRMPLLEFTAYIMEVLGLFDIYSDDTAKSETFKMNLLELLNSIEVFTKNTTCNTLDDYLTHVALYTDADDKNATSCVNISTIHSSKGLEFKTVFVSCLEENIFPNYKCLNSENSEFEIEEERRLMYVAITRAKERLFLTNSETRFLYGKTNDTYPSRFLEELQVY